MLQYIIVEYINRSNTPTEKGKQQIPLTHHLNKKKIDILKKISCVHSRMDFKKKMKKGLRFGDVNNINSLMNYIYKFEFFFLLRLQHLNKWINYGD